MSRVRIPAVTTPLALGGLAVLLLAALPLVIEGRYTFYVLSLVGILAITATGLNVLAGQGGQVSLGHAGLYAIGAYAAALLVARLGLSYWLALPLVVALATLVGMALAIPTLRVEGPYLAMVTIAFGIIVQNVLVEAQPVTGGHNGLTGIPRPALGDLTFSTREYYVVVVVAMVASTLVGRNLTRSAWGKSYLTVTEAPLAAASVGLDGYHLRVVAFGVSAAFAGLAGQLYAFLNSFVSPDTFGFDQSIAFLLAVIFGGLGTTLGPVVGAAVLTLLPELLKGLQDARLITYGVLLLVTLYALPRGLVGSLEGRWRRQRPARPRLVPPDGAPAPTLLSLAPPHGRPGTTAALAVRHLSVRYGGVAALDDVSLTLVPGSIHGLIGPNGAGKTTLVNAVSGLRPPTRGEIHLFGRRVEGLRSHRIARLGLARTFQTSQLVETLSVLDNVASGLWAHGRHSLITHALSLPATTEEVRRHEARALELLGVVGFAGDAARPAAALPLGPRRLVEIARALATDPGVILLDEPAAGLSPGEVAEMAALLARLRAAGLAVLLVEHHVELVLGLADHVTVLDHGRVLAEGPPDLVRDDPAVVSAYLGPGTVATRRTRRPLAVPEPISP